MGSLDDPGSCDVGEHADEREDRSPDRRREIERRPPRPESNTTMLELVDVVREVTGSSSELVFEPLPIGDPTRRRPDITRARELLGWEPTVDLRAGLSNMRDWYLGERAHGRA